MEYSKRNPLINIEYIKLKPENKYFDVKSDKIKASDLISHFSVFANVKDRIIVVSIKNTILLYPKILPAKNKEM